MTSKATDATATAVEHIDPEGDVIMVVGPDKRQLRVNSSCLRLASKVFRIMLGADWSEGQRLSKDDPPRVALEEDNADAIQTIFYVLHHRNEPMPRKFTAEDVLELAIASDKYDLAVALQYVSAKWLAVGSGGTTKAGYRLTAAFLFGDAEEFKRHSLYAMLFYKKSYMGLLNDRIAQLLPMKTIYLLGEGRNRMRLSYMGLLCSAIKDCCSVCSWGVKRKDGCLKFLSDNDPSKYHLATVYSVIEDIRRAMDESGLYAL